MACLTSDNIPWARAGHMATTRSKGGWEIQSLAGEPLPGHHCITINEWDLVDNNSICHAGHLDKLTNNYSMAVKNTFNSVNSDWGTGQERLWGGSGI